MTLPCLHTDVQCLNPYELIRKYRCSDCGAVMMCACDESIGRRFLPHQIGEGHDFYSQQRVAVTEGFQSAVCRECRGFPAEPHPLVEAHGRTTKLKRYYWREIAFREFELLAEVTSSDDILDRDGFLAEARKSVEQRVIQEMKELHQARPKYVYADESDESVLRGNGVSVIDLRATYLKGQAGQKARLIHKTHGEVSAEKFASLHFENQGYQVMELESRPLHALFGVYMWMLISDPSDPLVQMAGFGARDTHERGEPVREIWTPLPDDFGTPAYGRRRAHAIERYFRRHFDEGDLQWLFDYWVPFSSDLRHYLWAHRDEDVERARHLLRVLPAGVVLKVLRYLVDDYWGRYLGWPDLLAYRPEDGNYLFAEVKASGDKLSENQKDWIRGNAAKLVLPFALVKIHRQAVTS